MARNPTPIPKLEDGKLDRDKVKAMFMESQFIDWTRFAEENGWDPHFSRRQFQVSTWQEEKRRIISETKGDVIRSLVFERKFMWTNDIIATLDRYPKSIDMGMSLAEAKMSQLADVFKDYQIFIKDKGPMISKGKKRHLHPWEKMSANDLSMLLKGLKDLTEAKLKALMLDKWAITKLELPEEDIDGDTGASNAPLITIEGKGQVSIETLQGFFDEYHDKPQAELPAPPKPVLPQNEIGRSDPPPEDPDVYNAAEAGDD